MRKSILERPFAKSTGLLLGLLVLLACMLVSVVYGVINTDIHTLIEAYTNFNGSNEHIVILETRVPRSIIAAAIGINLGIAGSILQALTRNPIGDVGIFGINGAASFAIVCSVGFLGANSMQALTWAGFTGALLGGISVYILGSIGRDGMTPLKMTLAGAALTALFSSFTNGILVTNEQALEEVLFWLAGSVADRKLSYLIEVLPFMIAAWVLALLLAPAINTFMLGEDVAKGLGQQTLLLKIGMGVVVIILSGCSVAVAGPIGFVGLFTPHLARYLTGNDMKWTILYSGLFGGILLVISDILARAIAMPQELPIGVMTALFGAPFFIYVIRKGMLRS
ncbi:iron ABC transporter permease [Brevibacillus laterosporus]|uniref:FecCD family ABC transporter permease n=1 Tax=Brevibacillus laterosporus TaxID=1465 RepID=UPI000B9A86DD|nr:iron ABC transporter permease [Brevibacillus laterosporus]MBG9771705.1 iron ABC transporter [Brevibacillus laterosporus]MBG9787596.1 iron ABC transporter [Brevibacillus laterosporus]MBG9796204.1 iron ABC transporter [Brevibacillus laterosporus]MCR8936508.1 iron ABC transporter permease [Brevibacillus laterosporus]MCZ0839147.1 iron ABC transporter permease [Brevibacillus laterosporus]